MLMTRPRSGRVYSVTGGFFFQSSKIVVYRRFRLRHAVQHCKYYIIMTAQTDRVYCNVIKNEMFTVRV